MALLVASRAAEFAKPWKSDALALPSVIQHSPVQKLCECPADFRACERVETARKSVLWLSWLPHALVSSPNLGKAKVRPPSPCRPHSPVQKLFCMTNAALAVRPRNVQYKQVIGRNVSLQVLLPGAILQTCSCSFNIGARWRTSVPSVIVIQL